MQNDKQNFCKNGNCAMKIYAVNSKLKLPDILFQEFMECIETYYQEQILRYRFWEDRQRSLLGHILSRYALINQFHYNNNEIAIAKNLYGKPYLCGHSNISFNISHSKDWVVCAINEVDIGIDVQEIKGIKLSIAEQFFTKEENDYLSSLKKEDQLQGFYDIWSLKEAYVKALGFGLSMPLKDFSIIKTLDSIQLESTKDMKYYFRQYAIEDGYKLSVCSKKNNFCKSINFLELNNIYMAFRKASN